LAAIDLVLCSLILILDSEERKKQTHLDSQWFEKHGVTSSSFEAGLWPREIQQHYIRLLLGSLKHDLAAVW
jgi:hypothetical protein